LEIRLATLNDIAPICQLYREFWLYNADLQPKYYKEATENGDYPKSVIINENADIFLAVENDVIMGLIHIREAQTLPYAPIVQHKYAEIVDFIVSAPYRRKGIGNQLMDAAKEWSKKRKLDYIELFVLTEAKGEISFYEKYGFGAASHNMRYTL